MTWPANPGWHLPPVGLLALCPLIAAGGTLLTAVCVALLFLVTLTLVSATMAALGRRVSPEARVLTLLLISGVWVTLIDLVLQACAYPLWATLGIYVPLLAANSLVLAVGEQSLRGVSGKRSVREGLALGGYAALWIVAIGLLREALGAGAVLSDAHLLSGLPGPFPVTAFTAPVLQTAPGALLLLALAAAVAAASAGVRALPRA